MPAELLQQISKLVAQMILAQTTEVLPTLGELTPWSDILGSLTVKTPAGTLPLRLSLLPSPEKPRGITAPQPVLPLEEEEVADPKEDAKTDPPSPAPDTAPTPPTTDSFTLALEKWATLEANARAHRQARQQALIKEKAAYREILAFARQASARVKSAIPQDFLSKVQKAVELQEHVARAEAQWHEEQRREEKKKALKLEQLQKLHELEEIREQLNELEVQQAGNTRPQRASEMSPRDPGPTAMIFKNATEPCGPLDGPRHDLRYVRNCQVCNLTGVSRTKNCPNYFLHSRFQSGEFQRYRY